jgi:hypothetical protein
MRRGEAHRESFSFRLRFRFRPAARRISKIKWTEVAATAASSRSWQDPDDAANLFLASHSAIVASIHDLIKMDSLDAYNPIAV